MDLKRGKEAIAIVGIGCRFPGGINSSKSFWEFLKEGNDAITEVPQDRWSLKEYYDSDREKKGKIYTKRGGFLNNISKFDPQFFGISPREAHSMDPQQRLLLETSWEALEDGGIQPESLRGTRTGVYVGIFIHDYENMHCRTSEYEVYGPHSPTGMSTTIAANRISYSFDFIGPSLVVDTACSSSLVAVHLACESLLQRETDTALAGGANAILRPEMSMLLCEAGMLSPDGYCKSFDDRANGYTRAEGVGMVVLKRLSDAERDGDNIYAVIRGTACNQDGNSGGMTVPNGVSQKKSIEDALKKSGLNASDIEYVEAHGTGTPVGDPIECNALGEIYGQKRKSGDPCIIGSVKSNIGHTESAAGIAGLMKLALMLKNNSFVPNLHFENPNPKIDFEKLNLKVSTDLCQWNTLKDLRIGALNSFGFGGTNAHAIVQEYKVLEEEQDEVYELRDRIFPISAKSEEALKAVSLSYLESLNNGMVNLNNFAHTLACHKGQHDTRLAVVADSESNLRDRLSAFIKGQKPLGISTGSFSNNKKKTVFVYSGMGQQWYAMGRDLYKKEPIYKEAIDKCCKEFKKHTNEWDLIEELLASEENSRMDESRISQPCIFALQVGLTELWHSYGIKPDAIVGHSVGEVASLYSAGALTFEDAVKVSYYRGLLQGKTAGMGTMLAVGLSLEDTENLIAGYSDCISVAAVNSPTSITIAGGKEYLDEIFEKLEEQKIFARFLNVNIPFHSPVMDNIIEELKDALSDIKPQKVSIPLVSTVTGGFIEGTEVDASYWCRNIRGKVNFIDAIKTLVHDGFNCFIEMSAHPVLAMSINENLKDTEASALVLPSLRRKESEQLIIKSSIGELYCFGVDLDWSKINGEDGKFINLPNYQFQRLEYWNETDESKEERLGLRSVGGGSMVGVQVHPLLGGRVECPEIAWQSSIGPSRQPFLNDHKVQGTIVYPAAGYVELALAATKEQKQGSSSFVIENLKIESPLILNKENDSTVQVRFVNDSFSIYSQSKPGSWSRHIVGEIGNVSSNLPSRVDIDSIKENASGTMGHREAYDAFNNVGLEYGLAFQGVKKLWKGKDEVFGEIVINTEIISDLSEYVLHPALLDSCFQIAATLSDAGTYLPVSVDKISLYKSPSAKTFAHVKLIKNSGKLLVANIDICDGYGDVEVAIKHLTCQKVEENTSESRSYIGDVFYQYKWLEKPIDKDQKIKRLSLPKPDVLKKDLKIIEDEFTNNFYRNKFYSKIEPQIDNLCLDFVIEAFNRLGFRFVKGNTFTTDDLIKSLGIIDSQFKLFKHLLKILTTEEILRSEDGCWKIMKHQKSSNAIIGWKELLDKYPNYQTELNLTMRCGSQLDKILTGDADPLSIIFPSNSTVTEQLYWNSPTFKMYNHLVRECIRKLIKNIPEGQTIRILEVGAGTGSLSSYVLPVLPAHQTEYVYTDISLSFTNQAQAKFKDYSFIEYKAFDLEKDPLEQGFKPKSFDIILASDAVHATKNLRNTNRVLSDLLVPGGEMILLEVTNCTRWFDLVFGTLTGWWLFEDFDIRPDHPTMPFSNWKKHLCEVGFESVTGISDSVENPLHTIIVAQTPDKEVSDKKIKPVNISRPSIILADSNNLWKKVNECFTDAIIIEKGDSFSKESRHRYIVDPQDDEKLSDVLKEIIDDFEDAPNIISFWDTDSLNDKITVNWLKESVNNSCVCNLRILQIVAAKEWSERAALYFITTGAQSVVHKDKISLAQTPVRGLARVAVSELNKVNTCQIDLSSVPSEDEIKQLALQISLDDKEDEIALRGSKRYVNRLVNTLPKTKNAEFTVRKSKTSRFDQFSIVEISSELPGKGEVEIEIDAAGLNFKDVARVMRLIGKDQEDESEALSLGLECAGRVTKVGEGVTTLKVNDRVMGLGKKCFSSYTVTDANLLVKIPESITSQEAATIPVSFISAYYSLVVLANIQKGERVLIHTATGGLGLAAIQIALFFGATVLATAGTEEKRLFLKSLDIDYVGDSRSLEFVDEINEYLEGGKVDVVLNTLSGKAVEKGVSLLCPVNGRFIELTNIHSDYSLPLSSMKNGITFSAFDLQLIYNYKPELLQKVLLNLTEHFDKGNLKPIPYYVFSVNAVSEAFKFLKGANHIGKVILNMKEFDFEPIANNAVLKIDEKGTYLITGGLGGFGLSTANWLVDCGVKHLVLTGRKGITTDLAKEAIAKLEAKGVDVIVEAADVTDEKRMKEVIDAIDGRDYPLKGVMHAAMVLDDVGLQEMTADEMVKVLNPKILGAWILHSFTKNHSLEFFMSFSSFATIVGSKSQGNYSAANAFLDSLSHYQQSMGINGVSICWGSIGDVGYVSQNKVIAEYFKKQGVSSIYPNQAWKIINYMMNSNCFNAGVMPIDWNQFAMYNPTISASPRFSMLISKEAVNDVADNFIDNGIALFPDDIEKRMLLLKEKLSQIAGDLLGISKEKMKTDIPLEDIGFDSLMAVELTLRIKQATNIELQKMSLLTSGLDVNGLAKIVSDEFDKSNGSQGNEITQKESEEIDDLVEELDDEDVDALLNEMLELED